MDSSSSSGLPQDQSTATQLRQFFARLVAIIGWLLLAVSALMILGTFLPKVPYLGLTSAIVSIFSAWFLVLPLLAAALVWFGTKSMTPRKVAGTVAALTAVGAGVINMSIIQAAEAGGADINMMQAFMGVEPLEAKPDAVVQFGSYEGKPLKLNIFKPVGGKGSAPVFVYIHGGGWINGDRETRAQDMRWFANQGYLVFNIDYPLSNDKQHLWNVVHDQIGCALSWIGAHAKEYGGNTEKFALSGESAGGNLAINAASMVNNGTLKSSCGGTIPTVDAVVADVPGVDLVSIFRNETAVTGPDVRRMVQTYTGGTPEVYPERYKAVASLTHLSPKTPPTVIFLAQNDHLVPAQSITDYAGQAQTIGTKLKLVSVPFMDHGQGFGSIGTQMYRTVGIKWLQEHGVAP